MTPIAICDEVYEHILFDGREAHSADDAARHARAHRAHRLGRQDLLAHRLEGRLRHRARRASSTRSPRRTSSPPSPRRPTCRRRSPTASARTTPITARSPAISGEARPLRRRPRTTRLRRRPLRRHLFHHRRRLAAPASTIDDVELCQRMTVEAGVTAVPVSAFYQTRGAAEFRPLLLLQARRGPRRRPRPPWADGLSG